MPRKYRPGADKPLSIEQARTKIARAMSDLLVGGEPGSISFRLKPAKKAGETYSLKLTKQQRETLIHATRIKPKLRERLAAAGDGTQTVGVTRAELDHLNDQVGQAAAFASHPEKRRLVAVLHKIADLFAEDHAGLFREEEPKARRPAPKTGDRTYQFKVTLLDIRPAIWRRILVPDCTLGEFHGFIQAAFGWEDCHLHQFEVGGVRYGPPEPDGMDFGLGMEDEHGTVLSTLLPKSKRTARWVYEYDFGDGWRHEVVFEGCPPADPTAKYPLCVEGERAGPPEDCGGPWGYIDYLAAVADPKHEQHDEMLEWRGPFDPEAFDPKRATREMRKVK